MVNGLILYTCNVGHYATGKLVHLLPLVSCGKLTSVSVVVNGLRETTQAELLHTSRLLSDFTVLTPYTRILTLLLTVRSKLLLTANLLADSHQAPYPPEISCIQGLGKAICYIGFCVDVKKCNLSGLDSFLCEVELDVNVLDSEM